MEMKRINRLELMAVALVLLALACTTALAFAQPDDKQPQLLREDLRGMSASSTSSVGDASLQTILFGAQQQQAESQYLLAMMRLYGRGVPQNFSRAAELYEMAGHDLPDALYYLGLLHLQGRGRSQSFSSAMELFQRAAERFEHAQAMYALGQMHAHGQGTPVDYSLALAWLRRAAQRNDPRISALADQVANELQAFLQQVEARVRAQEEALGTAIRVTIGAVE